MISHRHGRPYYRRVLMALTLLVGVYLLGCASGATAHSSGFSPETAGGISNLLTTAGTLGPVVAPSPWGQIIQTVSFLLLALLTAWQTWTHKAVLEIKSVVTPTKKEQTR